MNQIREENDIATLESLLPMISYSFVSKEEFQKIPRETLFKYMQLHQLCLEHFHFTKNYMKDLNKKLDTELEAKEEEVE